MIEHVKDLIDAGVSSFKIEGRMKSPEYVGYITRLYRKAIDKYYDGEVYKITEKELDDLKVLFNRKFTKGFLFNDKEYINQETPNHQGIEIGKVLETTDKKITIIIGTPIQIVSTSQFPCI